MKKILLFHFESCPYCKQARRWIEEARAENPALRAVEIEMIDELRNPKIAWQYDYWYVPTFYVDGCKAHEGACSKEKVKQILETAAE
jgi:glutaredoxin